MFAGAGVCRAIGAIAAVLLMVVSAIAQTEADRITDNFASDADRANARDAEAARKHAEKAHKSTKATAKKTSEIRREAEAQRVRALARIKAEQSRQVEQGQAVKEEHMPARGRQEAEAAEATGEIRQLIEEAEAARRRAEDLLAQEREPQKRQQAGSNPALDHQEQDELKQARKVEAEVARVVEQARAATAQASDHRRRLSRLARVRQARLAGDARRAAQAAEAQRVRDEEAVRAAFVHATDMRGFRAKLVLMMRLRQMRVAAEAQRAAEARLTEIAEAERIRQLETIEAPRATADTKRDIVARERSGARALGPSSRDNADEERDDREVPQADRQHEGPAAAELDRFVTVLMIMAPGNYGIRRGVNTADPVLCTIDGCYISAGADNLATFLPRRKALGFGNTMGHRAGACRQSLSCAFRGVALDLPGLLQPVDLHILKHDRRRPQIVTSGSDCRLLAGRLNCARGFYAEDYVLWIVPERLANEAGPAVLERALRDGLAAPRSVEAPARPVR